MGWGEHDQVHPSLIITEPCIPQPTACAQGPDNRKGSNTLKIPEKAKGYLMSQVEWHSDLPWSCRCQDSSCQQCESGEKMYALFQSTNA